MWPILKVVGTNSCQLVNYLLDIIIEHYGSQGILMPTFTNGFNNKGVCNFDKEKTTTGVLSKALTNIKGSKGH